MRLAFPEQPSAQQKRPIGDIDPAIARVAFQTFEIVKLRFECRMSILFQVQSCQVQRLVRSHLFRHGKGLCRIRQLFDPRPFGLVENQHIAVSILYSGDQVISLIFAIQWYDSSKCLGW